MDDIVVSYTIGRLYTKWFRGQMNAHSLAGNLTYIETKGFLECRFSIKTNREFHNVITNVLRKLS